MGADDERRRLLHELRNCLQVISANLMPLAFEVTSPVGHEILDDIGEACEGATRICRLLGAPGG